MLQLVNAFAMADSDGDGSVAKSDVVSAVEANAPHKKMKRFSGQFRRPLVRWFRP